MRPTPEERQRYLPIVQDIISRLNRTQNVELVERMVCAVLRMTEDDRRADLKLTAAALEELERAFDVLAIYSDQRKVALFGSARISAEGQVYAQARDFAAEIARRDYMVITGAGPGVMAAGNEGAGRERSFGMNITLPFETAANEFIADDHKLLDFKYFFTRKLAFVKDSHAAVLCPGGWGTLDEGFEVLTLIQTGKAQLMPFVCLHPPGSGFWDPWDAYIKDTLLARGMISEADLALYKVTDSVEEACDEICRFYRRYHSMRFHEGALLLRVTSPVSEQELDELNQEFSDLLGKGIIELAAPPADEASFDRHLKPLPHLRFHYRFGRSGRLRQLIDRINDRPVETADMPPERGEGGRLPVETDPGH